MTSETDAKKTNEFLRRRKLRIQQVREQSKEIAKKIRQRAKVEKLRYLESIDGKLQKEHSKHQNNLINKLEQYYAGGVSSVGTGHKNASDVNLQEVPDKPDLSKKRGKEAFAELKRKKQELLDEKKKILDRRLQAREIANIQCKDKTSKLISKLIVNSKKSIADKGSDNPTSDQPTNDIPIKNIQNTQTDKPETETKDMATQWDFEEIPKEWEPNVPKLCLSSNDDEPKSLHLREDNCEKPTKRLNLFAVSDEMPASLGGRLPCVPEEPTFVKPSLTLVSEYLQSRGLRLRESSTSLPSKHSKDDLQSIKQTLGKTRATKQEVKDKNAKSLNILESNFLKQNPVKMYNHSTRDVQDVAPNDARFVSRDLQSSEDAYSQAVKESTTENSKESEHHKQLNEMRTKLAVSRQTVEKEYKDTMSFLNSLPKGKSKSVKNAYLDEHRQQEQRQNRQKKMQNAYKEIEKESRRHKFCHNTSYTSNNITSSRGDSDDDFATKDFQYSWMPVPDSDRNLAIHTIPTTFKPPKSGNSVKFNKVDSYHEYRSRHKHTPPTKEGSEAPKKGRKKVIESSSIDQEDSESEDDDPSESSDTSTVVKKGKGKIASKRKDNTENKINIDKIILYKILQAKIDKKGKRKNHVKLLKNLVKSLSPDEKTSIIKAICMSEDDTEKEQAPENSTTKVAFEQLKEGVYKAVNKEGGDNMSSFYISKTSCESNKSPRGSSNDQESPENIPETYSLQSVERQSKCKRKQKKEKSSEFRSEDVCKEDNIYSSDKNVSAPKPLLANQLSQVPSSVSFKSAMTETTRNPAKNGLMRILEDSSTESSKFYVGATGSLQENDYEVVIQLRKKTLSSKLETDVTPSTTDKKENTDTTETADSEFQHKKHNTLLQETEPKEVQKENLEYLRNEPVSLGCAKKLESDNTSSVHTDQKEKNVKSANETELRSSERDISIRLQRTDSEYNNIRKSSNNLSNAVGDKNTWCVYDKGIENIDNSKRLDDNSNSQFAVTNEGREFPSAKKISTITSQDKSVLTSPVPCSSHINNVPIRKANTISTQTTLETIDCERPALHHMSSTSTAYMSPPNCVLPAFFKNKHDGMEKVDQNGNLKGNQINLEELKKYGQVYVCCKCNSCQGGKNNICTTSRSSSPHPKSNADDHSYIDIGCSPEYDSASASGQYLHSNRSTFRSSLQTKKCRHSSRPSCKNTESPRISRISLISNNHRHKKVVQKKSKNFHKCRKLIQCFSKSHTSKRSLVLRPRPSEMSANSQRKASSKNVNRKITLSPIIKSYIDHLLDLNKESLKALAVMNQDCSSVATPSSSIIDEPLNVNFRNTSSKNICLQQIKDILKQQVLEQININSKNYTIEVEKHIRKRMHKYSEPKSSRKNKDTFKHPFVSNETSHRSVAVACHDEEVPLHTESDNKPSTKSVDVDTGPYTDDKQSRSTCKHRDSRNSVEVPIESENRKGAEQLLKVSNQNLEHPGCHNAVSLDYKQSHSSQKNNANNKSFCASTQTNKLMDKDVNYMKLAEHKLQNMEKIADLTEKCTKRLSNLAKVLEEVRRNKSSYSQMSDSSSESDRKYAKRKLDRPLTPNVDEFVANKDNRNATPVQSTAQIKPMTSTTELFNKNQAARIDICSNDMLDNKNQSSDTLEEHQIHVHESRKYDISVDENTSETAEEWADPFLIPNQIDDGKESSTSSIRSKAYDVISAVGSRLSVANVEEIDSLECTAFLKDLPKPDKSKDKNKITNTDGVYADAEPYQIIKNKGKPPTALSRIHLKSSQHEIVPHELSTVIEIDSPLSVKLKNQSTAVNTTSHHKLDFVETQLQDLDIPLTANANPDLLQANVSTNLQNRHITNDLTDGSRMEMMDLKQFNEIMLKPFISLQEYAKQCNINITDEVSNLDNVPKDGSATEDTSHQSDGSLPDVVAELIKRKVISEPFKSDTGSNPNSTALSSESTFSVLALSKIQKKKIGNIKTKTVLDTSDSMSISSNPCEFESVLKKMGMGWASSTLKKTKERLALSSSSNTSSTSFSQSKNKDDPVVITDTSAVNESINMQKNKNTSTKNESNTLRNVEQQTSHMNATTVKEFLTNELAKKMTFTKKSRKHDLVDEFVSLCETKMFDDMKHFSPENEERTEESGSNNRARTSTPVQIYKSNAFYSSTSSNMSNGLFSNADLSSVKGNSNSPKHHSTSEKDDLTIPNCSLRMKRGSSDCSRSD